MLQGKEAQRALRAVLQEYMLRRTKALIADQVGGWGGGAGWIEPCMPRFSRARPGDEVVGGGAGGASRSTPDMDATLGGFCSEPWFPVLGVVGKGTWPTAVPPPP